MSSPIYRLWQAIKKGEYRLIIYDQELRFYAGIIVASILLPLVISGLIELNSSSAGGGYLDPRLRTALKEIHNGKILFNPPHEMEQGKPERVETRISFNDIEEAISKNLKGRGDPEIERIEVGRKMSVTLTADDEAFKITKYSSDEQLVAGRPFAQWEWDVTPLQSGEHQLHLKAVINLDVEKDSVPYDIPVIDRSIKVKVNPAFIATQAAKNKEIRDLLIGSGSLLAAIGGIYAGIKAWRKRKKKREEDEKGKPWETVSNPPDDNSAKN